MKKYVSFAKKEAFIRKMHNETKEREVYLNELENTYKEKGLDAAIQMIIERGRING